MKKLTLIGFFLTLFISSCRGPEGPPGFDGADGVNILGETYEIDNVSFTSLANTFSFTFPQNIVNGDAVLVYRLERIDGNLDIWEPLPTATIFFNGGGYLQYRFNYTLGDVDIIIEGDDLASAGSEFLSNQVFRIIVVPSDLIRSLDTSNMKMVMEQLHISNTDIQTIDIPMQ